MNCVITFFNHFGAVRYKREAERSGWKVQLSPVPRSLSSSCGTCVKYTAPEPLYDPAHDEMEQTVRCEADGSYTLLWKAANL